MEGNVCVEIISIIVSAILSIVSIGIAINASCQTKEQIELSNKHKLFDRRLEKFLIFRDLLKLYSNSRKRLIENNDLIYEVETPFISLTNSSCLSITNLAMDVPLKNYEQNILLEKLELIEKYATEISILWNNEAGNTVCKFMMAYKDLLDKLYKQRVCQKSLSDYQNEHNGNIKSMISLKKYEEKLKSNANEIDLFETINEIDEFYNQIIDNNYEKFLKDTLDLVEIKKQNKG